MKRDYPLLFKRKKPITHNGPFAETPRTILAYKNGKTSQSGLLTANGQPLPMWINILTESSMGIYSMTPAATLAPELLATYESGYFNGGTGIVDDKLYGIYFDTSLAAYGFVMSYLYSFDTTTWEIADEPAMVANNLAALETAMDPATGEIFGEFYNSALSGLEFGVIDYANQTRTTIGSATNSYVALGCSTDGYAYGIATDGNLYRIDRTAGTETLVGSTGIQLEDSTGAVYYQTGEIDPKTNVFYWAATDANGATALYTVNLTDASVTQVGTYSVECNNVGMMIPAPAAEDGAPAVATNLAANFQNADTTGTITFTAPTMTFDSTTALTGSLNYVVIAGGDSVRGTTTPGASTTANVSVHEGMNQFIVLTSNGVGNSPKAKISTYVGYDIPMEASDVTLDVDDNNLAQLSWTAPTTTRHNGYLGDLTYDVYRFAGTDTTKVATDLTTTSFSETLPQSQLTSYTYGVVAKNAHHSSGLAMSNGKVVGSAYDVPYFDDFTTGIDTWTVIDANNDERTWSWVEADGSARYRYDSDNSGDDWLISPPINLKAGKTYSVSFKARSFGSYFPERIEAFWGNDNTVAAMTDSLAPATELRSENYVTLGKEISPSQDGEYYFGLHAISDADEFYLYVDSFNVEMAAEVTAPDSVKALTATSDPSGSLTATLSFTAPTTAINGSAISSLDSIEIRRGDSIINVMRDVAPGETYSYTDDEAEQGNNVYTVTPYNESGFGRRRSIKVYVGEDIPEAPEMTAEDRITSVNLSWNTPKGASGGVIIPAFVSYSLYNVDDNGYIADSITSVRGRNSYEITGLNTNEGDTQNFKMWAIQASNIAGSSSYGTAAIITGRPYVLPFHNSFKDGTLENQFVSIYRTTSSYEWNVSGDDTYDNDGGALSFYSSTGAHGYIGTGKISFAGAVNPKLLFYYKAPGSLPVNLYVTVEHQDGTVDAPVYSVDLSSNTNTDWQRVMVDLPASLADESYVILHFNADATDGMDYDSNLLVDNINVIDPEQRDAAIDIEAPTSLKKGQTADIEVTASNQGLDDLTNAHVLVTANGVNIADTTISKTLTTLESVKLPFTYRTTTLDDATSLSVTATVSADGDLVADNDEATATIETTAEDVTEPSNLTASTEAEGHTPVTLAWEAPSNAVSTVTDDFESYDSWSLSFGDWTTIDADKGYAGSLTQSGTYTHQGEQFAFMNWAPSDIFSTGQGLDPHSGTKGLVSIYQIDEAGENYVSSDNWLISPRLSGNAQTISFWANNYNGDGFGAETFQVLASTTGNAQADFTQVGTDYTQSTGNWTLYTVDLPEGTTYFAIRQTTSGDNAFLFMLDDFTYETSDAPVGYNVYRDGEYIATVATPGYVDTDSQADGTHTYQVTAVYAQNVESAPISTTVVTSIRSLEASGVKSFDVYTLDGVQIRKNADNLDGVKPGVYVINGVKTILRK